MEREREREREGGKTTERKMLKERERKNVIKSERRAIQDKIGKLWEIREK